MHSNMKGFKQNIPVYIQKLTTMIMITV